MELGLDSLLLLYSSVNLSILSYFGNKMEILLLFLKNKKKRLRIERDSFNKTLKSEVCQRKRNQIG